MGMGDVETVFDVDYGEEDDRTPYYLQETQYVFTLLSELDNFGDSKVTVLSRDPSLSGQNTVNIQ
jgi:hypothetical protein